MPTDLEHLVDLRLRTAPGESPDIPAARACLAGVYEPILAQARRIEKVQHGEQWVGLVLCSAPIAGRFGVPEPSVIVLLDPHTPELHPWAASILRQMAPDLPEHCSLELNAADAVLRSTAGQLGFGCAKVDLTGSVAVALERLRGGTVNPADLGVVFSKPKVQQIQELDELVRDFFLAYPEFGWGGPVPSAEQQTEIDRREQESLVRRLTEGPDTDFVVCRQGRILGTFWFVHRAAHPLLGSCAGLNIILQPELQGQGLGKAAYLHMLEQIHNLGTDTIFGRTSNPGVIHIGQAIGRRLRRIILRRDGPFISEDLIEGLVG